MEIFTKKFTRSVRGTILEIFSHLIPHEFLRNEPHYSVSAGGRGVGGLSGIERERELITTLRRGNPLSVTAPGNVLSPAGRCCGEHERMQAPPEL